MLNAELIQNKEFTRAMRGYKEEEVDEFLDEIISDYQSMTERIAELEARLADSDAKLAGYKSMEGAVITTLESAKTLMNDIAVSAEKRANMLVENAEIEAANKLRQADESLTQLRAEEAALKSRVVKLRANIKSALETELERLAAFGSDVAGE